MPDMDEDYPQNGGRIGRIFWGWQSKISPRLSVVSEKAESRYLGLLRVSSLVIATILLVGAAIFVVSGLVKQIGSSDVEPELAQVAVGDIIPAEDAAATEKPSAPKAAAATPQPLWKTRLTSAQQTRLFALYADKFEPSRRADEERVGRDQFFTRVFPDDRLQALDALPLERLSGPEGKPFANFGALADDLVRTMGEAAATASVKRQLGAYKRAAKVEVCETKIVVRKRQIAAWDSNSMSCPYWYEYPYGCSVTRTVDDPTPTRACEMRLPETLKKPVALYAELVGRYAETAAAGVDRQALAAEEERARILARKAEGKGALLSAGQWFLAFLAVMFLYLVVAIERHQRRLAARLEDRLAQTGVD